MPKKKPQHKEHIKSLYRTFRVSEETAYKLDRIFKIARGYNTKYSKNDLLNDAIDNLFIVFQEIEEANENGTLEIEYEH